MRSGTGKDSTRQAGGSDDPSRLAAFEEHRGLLFSIAYRMLGSVADAEDTLQDAFIRWQHASDVEVRSPKAYLVTIVSRLCISNLQSARVRRETYVGEWLPEPLVSDPLSSATELVQVDESVSMALLLMLERLTPEERAVFLLHEVFDYTHSEIASLLNLTEVNCRQLLRRAQQHVHVARPRFNAPARDHMELLERFQQAAASGDMDQLVGLLSSDVVLHSDGGGKAAALPLPIIGADKVARAAMHGFRRLMTLNPVVRLVSINGVPGFISYVDGRPQSVFTVETMNQRIRSIYIVTNPEKLAHLPPPPS
jgi:RNA polymerase sigma-70 factor (ECF subfamily)